MIIASVAGDDQERVGASETQLGPGDVTGVGQRGHLCGHGGGCMRGRPAVLHLEPVQVGAAGAAHPRHQRQRAPLRQRLPPHAHA